MELSNSCTFSIILCLLNIFFGVGNEQLKIKETTDINNIEVKNEEDIKLDNTENQISCKISLTKK